MIKADNQVLSGIRLTARLLKSGRIVICRGCAAAIREFSLYCWDDRNQGLDQVRKEHDHAMDEIRYFAATVAGPSGRVCPLWMPLFGSSPGCAAGWE